jgi:hypothetical protein
MLTLLSQTAFLNVLLASCSDAFRDGKLARFEVTGSRYTTRALVTLIGSLLQLAYTRATPARFLPGGMGCQIQYPIAMKQCEGDLR